MAQGEVKTCATLVRIAFLLGRLKRRYDWWKDRKGSTIFDDYDHHLRLSGFRKGMILGEGDANLQWFNLLNQVNKLPRLYDDWMLGLSKEDRDKLRDRTPRFVDYSNYTLDIPPSDEITVINFLENLIAEKGSSPYFTQEISKDECLWILDYTTETLIKWQNDLRDVRSPVERGYLEALPKLLNLFAT